ncbi:MAG: hypothetical protein M3R46_15070 [Actinomycetota bacterium]|jgi:hypothetical protein|nr:hypothetical protein [Thermoleophilaceae bacterium]MDQ3066828.1 hypothetical protein [Actinomycetota bacterium]MDQ3092947.1 hypothetical protein [Actinomycetota bacterium]
MAALHRYVSETPPRASRVPYPVTVAAWWIFGVALFAAPPILLVVAVALAAGVIGR